MDYKQDTVIKFGKYKGKTIKEIWSLDSGYIMWAINKIDDFNIKEEDMELLRNRREVNGKNYCYKGYIDEFLIVNESDWLLEVKGNFNESYDLKLEDSQIEAWKDCFHVLKDALQGFRGKKYYLIFEYKLPHEGGRRPDVILLSDKEVFILEFKMKNCITQADMDQVSAYARDIREYHYESRNKSIVPLLIPTSMIDLSQELDGVIRCAPNSLYLTLHSKISDEITSEPSKWLNSKYEPLPTIVDAAKRFMKNEPLPNIKRVNSTGIPEAIELLKKITEKAEKEKKHIIALVTGVPGAGKTFLGLNFVYNKNDKTDDVNSVYLSGNGPLIKVLTDGLNSKVFVKDLHREMDEFFVSGNKSFNKNIVVFDEGQRIWDDKRISQRYNLKNKTEADMMIEMIDKNTEWSVLIVLVGEGQEINKGEGDGLKHWSKAIRSSRNKWSIICPDKLDSYFNSDDILESNDRKLLNLTVSLRSHLSGDVSNFINNIISGNIEEAATLTESIRKQGFTMLVTRDLNKAKKYCFDRYKDEKTKRYGLLASSKAKNLVGYVDNSFEGTKKVNVGWWYNRDKGNVGSCCNLNEVVTEFACQGLELDMPILCWGTDMKWDNGAWEKEKVDSLAKQYRTNSYRVLLTRGRDGFIIFIPNDRELDLVYNLFRKIIGLTQLD